MSTPTSMPTGETTATARQRNPERGFTRWGIVIASTFVLAVAAGGRFMVGLVFDEIRQGFSVSHSTLGLVVSLNVLLAGLFQPFVGWLVDRVQVRLIAAGGLAVTAIGILITAQASTIAALIFGYGILVAFGHAAVSPVTITPLVAAWFQRKRATALSIVSMGHPLGQLAIVPSLALMVGLIGWRAGYAIIAIALFAIGAPLLLLLLKERPVEGGKDHTPPGCPTSVAIGQRSFWLLGLGFFVCGFTMSWVMTFFFDYTMTQGFSRGIAASALSLMGGMSIIGALFTGWWADRIGVSVPLGIVYALRGLGFGMIMLSTGSGPLLLLSMAVIGFSWSSTVPLTSAICADIYGRRSLGMIFGLMFAIMPIGSAVGAGLTGYLYDWTGSYEISLILNLASGLIAAVAVVVVRSKPIYSRTSTVETRPVLAD